MLEIRPRDTWRLLVILALGVIVVFIIMCLGNPPVEDETLMPAADDAAAKERALTILFASVALVGVVLSLVVGVSLSYRYRSARRRRFSIYDGADAARDVRGDRSAN